ncbi:unnamed protein product [Coffea canephora]|uniref:Uncharacterized protein n=2 Tax=Coffea TaxID=13442 RepID=A0A068U8R5_COFCA|nr:uncharacterized protein LOC113731830 [Coffea arabica]XP_027178020.1 uncharacterized protein LOC113777179 [Coffea eugenioides]CDP04003.1 unnamed protein product [Coffea canephora]
MLENPAIDSSAAANVAPVKRYAPPNQRNRALGRRKSGGDRLERANSYPNDGEKTQISVPKNVPLINHGDAGSSKRVNENSLVGLIPIHGCCNSEAFQLLNDRWAAAMNALNSLPEDSSERPVLYSRSGSPWGQPMLPHMLMPSADSSGLKKDFLSELRYAMRNANAVSDA